MSMPDLAPGAPSRVVEIDVTVLTEDAPKSGSLTFSLAGDLRVPGTGKIIAASSKTVQLAQGKGQIRLPVASGSVMDDAGDSWVVTVKKSWMTQPYGIRVPAGTGPVNLADLAPARALTARETSWALSAASVDVTTVPYDTPAGGSVALDGGTLRLNLRVPQGLPGPGATATDDAVAAMVKTTSKTRTALEGAYRRGYSPREFGVVGNGTVDDTAAWNAVLAGVPAGATIVCPEGDRYRLTGPITIGKPVTLEGGEFLPHTTGRCLDISASDVTIRGSRFTSASASDPVSSHQIIAAVGTQDAPLRNVHVDRCIIDRTRYHGIWLEWCEDAKVTNSTVTDFQYAGVMLISVARGEVSGCVIRNGLQEGGIANAYGIAVTDLANSIAARSRDVLITRNIVDNIPRWEGIDTHGGERITITDNVVSRCYDGIAAVVGNSSRVTAPRQVIISGNTIDSMGVAGVRSAIRLYGKSGGEQASAAIGPNVIRGDYVMDVEATQYEATTIQAQATTVTGGYSSHPAPYRSWAAVAAINRNGNNVTRTITLPAGVFTQAPMVFLTPQPGGTNVATGWTWQIAAASKDEITISGYGPTGLIDIQMGIYCVQMGHTSAAGIPRN